MTDQIEKSVKQERGRAIKELETELQKTYFNQLIGERLQLLVEKVDSDGIASGPHVDTPRFAHMLRLPKRIQFSKSR